MPHSFPVPAGEPVVHLATILEATSLEEGSLIARLKNVLVLKCIQQSAHVGNTLFVRALRIWVPEIASASVLWFAGRLLESLLLR